MISRLSRYASLLLIVFVLSVWLPMLHGLLFEEKFGKTHLFYSPVIDQFVYRELVGEGHQFNYRDESGQSYSRQEFEQLIPFIYYKNMELWGKLPLAIAGERFDKQTIRAARQVLEIKPVDLGAHSPRIPLYPLFESNPGRARLSFPENVFRPDDKLSFIHTDFNRFEPALTERFGGALGEAGFAFPVRAVFGRVSILKAFDAGYFLLDNDGALFHLIRVDGEAKVEQVALPDGVQVRHISVAENKRREVLGMMLDEAGRLYLLGDHDYRFIPLSLPDYDPDRMELKIIFNPLYRTAIYSDDVTIHAALMDRDYRPLRHYSRVMAMADSHLGDDIWNALITL